MKVLSCMKMYAFVVIAFFLTNEVALAQPSPQKIPTRQDEFYQMIEEMRTRHREMIKSLMYDDVDFDSLFKQMEKSFDGRSFEDMFQGRINPIIGEYDWVNDGKFKILKLKVTQVKDKPLDIKIENQMIRIKGVVESLEPSESGKTKSVVQFERMFSLPDDVDATNPSFENKEGELLIKFPLKKSAQPIPPASSSQKDKPRKAVEENERVPVLPSGDEPKI